MRLEIAGAQITDDVVEVLDTLQNEPSVINSYTLALDRLTRMTILDLTGDDAETDAATFRMLRTLQLMRRDLCRLAAPDDVDEPENDTPLASF